MKNLTRSFPEGAPTLWELSKNVLQTLVFGGDLGRLTCIIILEYANSCSLKKFTCCSRLLMRNITGTNK